MVVLADFPAPVGQSHAQPHLNFTCSSRQVAHHPREVVAVGVAVAQEEDVLVVPGQPLSALVREGEAGGLDLTGGTVTSGGVALVTGAGGGAVTPAVPIRS